MAFPNENSSMSNDENPGFNIDEFKTLDKVEKQQMLVEAVILDNPTLVETLINLGVSVHTEEYNRLRFYAYENQSTPVMIAANLGHLSCLEVLIRHGADVNFRDSFDVTSVHLAAQYGHSECLQLLLDSGADPNVFTRYTTGRVKKMRYLPGTTPLHLASMNNHVQCVRELMQFGADCNAVDEKGFTALYIAAEEGFEECVLALLRNTVGRDILSVPGFDTGDTPLHFAVRRGMIDSVRELLQVGADVNHENYTGHSPFHICLHATGREDDVPFEILKLLVLYGHNIDVNLPDYMGISPLHYVAFDVLSVEARRPNMANFLIAYGANINIVNHDRISLIKFEYNSRNPDVSLLQACVNSMCIPPFAKDLKVENFPVENHLPNNVEDLYSLWLALNEPDPQELFSPEYADEIRRIRNINDDGKIRKQTWYEETYTGKLPTLKHQCRSAIRSFIGYKNLRQIKNLSLPYALKSYLVFDAELPD